jgi:N-acetylglucosaminyl-diphospho-decaprenol L-rhamnosyltransferase
MPTVLLCSYSPELGGAERALLDFAAALDGERWLACPPGPLADAARRGGMRVATVRSRRLESISGHARDRVLSLGRQAGFQRELAVLERALRPGLIVACGMRAMLALTTRPRPSAPLVFLHNDLLPAGRLGAIVRRAAARADLIIVPSATVAADLGRPAVVIHPGVETERFAGDEAPVLPPEIVVLGALIGWKHPELALEIFARVRAAVPQARLRYVGAPLGDAGAALLATLQAQAEDLGLRDGVEFAGAVADPAGALARATCLLHCADREPFGLAVAEALASGRPAVVPACAGAAEIVSGGGGVTYPPGDVAAAAAAVVALIEEPSRARAIGAWGRERVRQRFSAQGARDAFRAEVAALVGDARAGDRPAPAWSLVTVTHNSATALESLLASVYRHAPQAHVIVVDNASDDGSAAAAEAWGSRLSVESVALPHNLGFGAACNLGVARAGGAVVALVNPDVELIDGSLAELVARAEPGQLLAPRVLSADGRRQDTVHPRPGSPASWLHAAIPGAALPAGLGAALEPWRADRERPVGWAVGCALVADTAMLRQLGPFDEQLFLYGEDLDLGLRARERGIETRFVPEAQVLHHGAHSTAPAFGGEAFERLARARREVIARRLGARAASADDVAQALTFGTRALARALLGRSFARERRQLRALAGARRYR